MKKRSFVPIALGAALMVWGCGDAGLVSPDMTQGELTPLFSKAGAGTAFTATVPLTVVELGAIIPRPNGSVHIRDQVSQGSISGDLNNSDADAVTVVTSGKIDAGGSGPAHGSFTITACHATLGCGTFEGRFKGRITGGLFADKFKAAGISGDFLGMRITGTFEETTPVSSVFILTGTIR